MIFDLFGSKKVSEVLIHTPDIYDVFGFNTRKNESLYRIDS